MQFDTIAKIARNAKKHSDEFEFVGVRIQENAYGVKRGDVLEHQSSVWDDGTQLTEKLNGVCAMDIEQVNRFDGLFGGYDGNIALVLGSKVCYGGNDVAEMIMIDPVVIDIIRK